MKIKCRNCEIEERANYKKLIRNGWRIFFLGNKIKIARCVKCRPVFPGFYREVGEQINRLKILDNLKTKEEQFEEEGKRIRRIRIHYKYQRNKNIEGSKKVGVTNLCRQVNLY